MKYATGAHESPYDIRTFAYVPSGVPKKGGKRYLPKDIQHQHKVGICTAISATQNASKALGKRFSAEFQYLMQKKLYDKDWDEGSSLASALKVEYNIGLLPEKFWTFTTEDDRKLPYSKYIAKLQKVTDAQIEELKVLASPYKIQAYASVRIDRDLMAQAINESDAGILTRYVLGKEWWTGQIEPLRAPKVVVSGHAVTDSNYAYRIHKDYRPTEAWIVHYGEVPEVVEKQLASRKKVLGSILNGLQEIIKLYQKLK
jgi:hypothetical protein